MSDGLTTWSERARRSEERYRQGELRLPGQGTPDERQRQLTQLGNAAYATGLSLLMDGRRDDASGWLAQAAERYRESAVDAPPGSWGRPIGAIKARLIAGDLDGARREAEWALSLGAGGAETAIGRYAAALAETTIERWTEARVHADTIRLRDDFPQPVGDALAYICAEDVLGYVAAIEDVLESFETREGYLEDVPVADTVLALQAIAALRGMAAELTSPLLPRA